MKVESLDTLYESSKFLFECGKYSEAAKQLYIYYILVCFGPIPYLSYLCKFVETIQLIF